LVEETGEHRENHRFAAKYWHIMVCRVTSRFGLTALVVIDTNYIGSC
jgi:hypothetical protein